jgi:hypothetical protein
MHVLPLEPPEDRLTHAAVAAVYKKAGLYPSREVEGKCQGLDVENWCRSIPATSVAVERIEISWERVPKIWADRLRRRSALVIRGDRP